MAHQSTERGTSETGAPKAVNSRKRWLWALPILTIALLGTTALWRLHPAWTGLSGRAGSLRGNLSLQLQKAGTDYRVAWDAKSPVVLAATRGTLLIKDGGFEKLLELDREQLRSAGVVYSPATADASFRLEIFGSGPEPAVATVRLLAGNKPEELASRKPEEPAAAPAAAEPTATPAPEVSAAPPPEQPAEQKPAETADQPAATTPTTTIAAAAVAPAPDSAPNPGR